MSAQTSVTTSADRPPLLSLCMIVRDNEKTLPACLESIEPWVDEMVVVDTGSTDQTPNIVRQSGARLFHFPWCDDFSKARNESLHRAQGEWLFWMDSDDTIDPENGRKLRKLAYGGHNPAVLGYVMQVCCPDGGADDGTDATVVDHVKMFRNYVQLRFEFRIHEQIIPAIRRLGGQVGWTDVFVVHSGADHSPEGRRRKYERDLRILGLDLGERPDHPFVLFNLGMTYSHMGEDAEAAGYLRRCLAVSDPGESHVRKAYALLVGSLTALETHAEARAVCEQGRALFPKDPELLFRRATLAHELGRLDEAVACYQAVLLDKDDRHFSSIDRGVVGYKARHNLALVYQEMGRPDQAELQWRHVVADVPTYRPGRRQLVETLIRKRKFVTAEIEIEKMLEEPSFRSEAHVLNAGLAEARRDLDTARRELETAIRESPGEIEPLQAVCRFLFEHGELAEAENAHRELIARQPDDAAAHHNLGLVRLRAEQYAPAAESLRESLRLRPSSAATWEQLATVLDAMGNHEDAAGARQEATRLSQKKAGETTDSTIVSESGANGKPAIGAHNSGVPGTGSELSRARCF